MTRIVRTAYRYKRPHGKRKPVAIEGPAVITAASKRRRASDEAKVALAHRSNWLQVNRHQSR